jgi:2-keto-4-pentenoate hydratase
MTTNHEEAAAHLYPLWQDKTRCLNLPESIRPRDRIEGYQVQQAFADRHGVSVVGWKIAATSIEGQKHIGVDGPLAGRLFADRVLEDGASVSLAGNLMRVAEIEFAFCFGQRLAPRASGYTTPEVLDAVSTMHPSIEIPDSRFENFVTAGAPQLIADLACANLFVLGPGQSDWRDFDYIDAAIQIKQNDVAVDPGFGRNVLGDPRIALTWLVNELSRLGIACEPGQFVTTGTCRVPVTVQPNDRIHADFGPLGRVTCSFSE